MPFYRIVIWTQEQKKQGIRWIDNTSISAVQGIMEHKAREVYRSELKDVEVQMLSKTCKAVKKLIKDQERKKEAKKWGQSTTPTTTGGYNPRKQFKEGLNIGEKAKLVREAEEKERRAKMDE